MRSGLGKYTATTGVRLTTYLYTISRNQYLKLRDHQLRRLNWENEYMQLEQLSRDEPTDIPANNDADVDDIARLERLLNQLKPEDEQLIRWAGLDNLSHNEIAAMLGISEAAAKQSYYRARLKLGALIKTYELSG